MKFSNPENDNPEKDSRVTMDMYLDSSLQCSGVGKKASVILRLTTTKWGEENGYVCLVHIDGADAETVFYIFVVDRWVESKK